MKSFPKVKRIVDLELLAKYRGMKCVVCSKTPCDPDHIQTKGAGHDDALKGIWPLCRKHHTEKGTIGLNKFVIKYPIAKYNLEANDWEYDTYKNKWMRYK